MAPELPVDNPFYAHVLNVNGDVVVGGEIKNYITINSYFQTNVGKFNQNVVTKVGITSNPNSLYIYDDKRKVWVNALQIDDQIWLKFGQQVKSFWGWNVYKESYYFRWRSFNKYRYGAWMESVLTDGIWNVTARISDNTKIYLGTRWPGTRGKSYILIQDEISVYACDMGSANTGDLKLSFSGDSSPFWINFP